MKTLLNFVKLTGFLGSWLIPLLIFNFRLDSNETSSSLAIWTLLIQHSATLATVLVSVNDDTTKHTHDARLERAGVALAVENWPLFFCSFG